MSSELVSTLRETFESGVTLTYEYRYEQLGALKRMYEENTEQMCNVLRLDLGKSKQESIITEVFFLINDLNQTIRELGNWMKPERPSKAFHNLLDSQYIFKEPYGVVLVIGAWNYPLQLTLLPVAGALAAGNCVLIKPSEMSKHTANFIADTIPKYLNGASCKVYIGGPRESQALLNDHRFDYVFYTGSGRVGRMIAGACALRLTPVTLELGGKCPTYLHSSCNLKISVRRILWGKFLNAGQTCISPDYLVVDSYELAQSFVDIAKQVLTDFYGDEPKNSPDFGRIINESHFDRLLKLIRDKKMVVGGQHDRQQLYIAPTILFDVKPHDEVMQEEIFGPVLPIMVMQNVHEVLRFIKNRPKPLSLYVFANDKNIIRRFIENTSSGGVLVNDTIMHLATDLPFGGVGDSGMGCYHGKHTFDTFSHNKSCLFKDISMLSEQLSCARYPPGNDSKISYLKMMLKRRGCPCFGTFSLVKWLMMFGVGYAAAHLVQHYQQFHK